MCTEPEHDGSGIVGAYSSSPFGGKWLFFSINLTWSVFDSCFKRALESDSGAGSVIGEVDFRRVEGILPEFNDIKFSTLSHLRVPPYGKN